MVNSTTSSTIVPTTSTNCSSIASGVIANNHENLMSNNVLTPNSANVVNHLTSIPLGLPVMVQQHQTVLEQHQSILATLQGSTSSFNI